MNVSVKPICQLRAGLEETPVLTAHFTQTTELMPNDNDLSLIIRV